MRAIEYLTRKDFIKHFLVTDLEKEKYGILNKGELTRKTYDQLNTMFLKMTVGWEIYKSFEILPSTFGCPLE